MDKVEQYADVTFPLIAYSETMVTTPHGQQFMSEFSQADRDVIEFGFRTYSHLHVQNDPLTGDAAVRALGYLAALG